MNEWQCQYAGCRNKVVGLGGAIGLRAIGWYFAPGPSLRCPLHRPDPAPCADEATEAEQRPEACSMCSGERDARRWQSEMNHAYGFDGPRLAPLREVPQCTSLPRDQSTARATSAPVTRAEFDALAERVARLEAPPEPDIDPKVEFNERCKELGARVRSKMLRPAGIVLSARDAYAMASELLSVLPSAHCSREPTINDCIVAVTGWGWPVEIIPAVARWLGFKDECGLEDALAEDVRRAVQARANS